MVANAPTTTANIAKARATDAATLAADRRRCRLTKATAASVNATADISPLINMNSGEWVNT